MHRHMSRVKVYKASAGSGKTFTLAVQYIRLLITTNPLEYRHTLAVTFTNKATAEMKDRILEQLYGISQGLKQSNGYLNALKEELKQSGITLSDNEIRKSCKESLRHILHDYSHFRIETIDSFFQAVLRNLAHELGLNARLQVDLNDKQILSQAVDNMIDGLAPKTDDMEGQKALSTWIDSYVADEIENAENWDIRKKIKKLSSIIFKEEYMRRDEKFRERINDENILRNYRKQLFALRQKANEEMADVVSYFSEKISAYQGDLTKDVSSGKWILTYRERLENEQYHDATLTEKRYDSLSDPTLMVKKGDVGNEVLLQRLRPISELIKNTEDQRRMYISLINTIDLSLQHINPLRLLNRVEQEVTEITNENNRFILAKTPILLYSLIKGNDAPFVFEKMGTLFHNVMIDEFQDTSKLQWENFKVLLLENQASGGSDLIVGDIKQSIYRFRNGDWHILKNISDELPLNKPDIQTLNKNFRSDTRIIQFNNAFFKQAASLLDTEEGGGIVSEIYDDVEQFWPDGKEEGGYVRVMLKTDKCDDWEELMLSDMCQQIKELHDAGLSYKKMAVLVRARTNVPKIIDYVQTHLEGVKMISDEGFKLESSRTITMLISALRRLCYGPVDTVSERFLIKQYMQLKSQDGITIEQYTTAKAEEVLSETFTRHIYELKEYPLNELCEELYRIFDMHLIEGEDAYILCFYDELANYLRNGTSDIPSFLEYWENEMSKKSIPACEVDGINIITIHKSKGLQYHTVLMPFCDESMEDVRSTEMLWCDAGKAPFNTMGSLPINGSKAKFESSEYADDYYEEKLQRRIEELNSLYVAFTRAEHNLYVWGNAATTTLTYASLLCFPLQNTIPSLLPTMTSEARDAHTIWAFGSPVVPSSTAHEVTVSPVPSPTKSTATDVNRLAPTFEERPIHFRSFNRKLDFRQSNEASQYLLQHEDDYQRQQGAEPSTSTTARLSYIERGKLLHELFSHIEHYDQLDKALLSFLDRGLLQDAAQMAEIRSYFDRGMANGLVRQWFSDDYTIQNECEILHTDPDTGQQVIHRPDRVMLSDDEVIVVDFKFGQPNPQKYVPQVQKYMTLLSEMYPQKNVKGYLWYVYQDSVEPVTL